MVRENIEQTAQNGNPRRRVRRRKMPQRWQMNPIEQQRLLSHIEKCFHRHECKECCWLWTGKQNNRGYGLFSIWREKKGIYLISHRLVLEYYANTFIPEGLICCHRCDVRLCCNPAHLFLGTHKDNSMDMTRKGRGKPFSGKGENNPAARLTQQEVDQIRMIHAKRVMTNKALAKQFKIGKSQLHNIISGNNWRNGHE